MSNFGKDVEKYPLSISDGECMNFIICRKTIEQYLSILKFSHPVSQQSYF